MIFTKRIMPRTSLEAPGILGIPFARPWDPRARPWDPRARAWDPPGDAPGTPRDLLGPFMDHKNGHTSTNIQRQKLSIAVLEPARCGPSHEGLDRAVFLIKRPPKSKKVPPSPGISPRLGHEGSGPLYSRIYIDIYLGCWWKPEKK